jgi:endo-1,4-beta-xylanase
MNVNRHGWTRRSFLMGSAATAAGVGIFGATRALASPRPLRAYAADKGILFGSSISGQVLKDSLYADLFTSQCAITVPEGSLKWDTLRPTPYRYDFSGGDWLYGMCKSHEILMRGHTLVWEGALPKWFAGTANAENARTMMLDHISTVVRHYAGKVPSWDVVNEAVQIEDGRPDGLKITPWLRMVGPEYIETAFQAAHEADPHATLVYNENWLEPEGAGAERKRNAVLTMLTRMKKNNVPVHGLGIQSHVYAEMNITGGGFKRFLQQVSDLGLSIMITEMDVREKNAPGDIAIRDRLIASQYYKYLSFMLQFPAVKTVITWGLSDRYTWIATHNPRLDAMPVRPLPYDAELRPTPVWDAIRSAFEETRRR